MSHLPGDCLTVDCWGSSVILKDSMVAGVFLALVMSALKFDMLRTFVSRILTRF